MLLAALADTSATVAATSSRSGKVAQLADCLRQASPVESTAVVSFLSGELTQRRTGVGWAALRELPPPASQPTLTVSEVDSAFADIAGLAGGGSQAGRRRLLRELLGQATEREQRFLASLVAGELRQGALTSLVVEAVALAAALPPDDVRRAVMLAGAVGPVATAVSTEGAAGLARFHLEVGRPVLPMLAQTASSVSEAVARLTPAAVEWKLDGVRVQVHRSGADVRVFTRTLDDITDRVPEVVDAVLALPVESVVLDGEAIALDAGGRPRPFQETGSRIGSRVDVERARRETSLAAFLFDILHVDGRDLLARSGAERFDELARTTPDALRVPRLVTTDEQAAQAFLQAALDRGHEGVVVKSLAAPYEAGRRGSGWVKVKPVHTLDLVVLAAEWGHGRRTGLLSNLHLGALAEERSQWQVVVRPELVVEIAFDGVQTSRRYPGGMALRFARVVRYRPDKTAAEVDTVDTVRAIHTKR
jgi:DNA ligase 1